MVHERPMRGTVFLGETEPRRQSLGLGSKPNIASMPISPCSYHSRPTVGVQSVRSVRIAALLHSRRKLVLDAEH